jgi:hypothetical protein
MAFLSDFLAMTESPLMDHNTGNELLDRLARIEAGLDALLRQKIFKEFYTTDEVASILGKSSFTVREWCRLGRIHGTKRPRGRGVNHEWIISHVELTRIQNHGLLPLPIKNSAKCRAVNQSRSDAEWR